MEDTEETIKKQIDEGKVIMNESYGKDNDPTIITVEDQIIDLDAKLYSLIRDYLNDRKEFKDQIQKLWHCIDLLGRAMEMLCNYLQGGDKCLTENQGLSEQKSLSSETPEVFKKP